MTDPELVDRIEDWFDRQGLPYFAGDRAEQVEAWLGSWRILGVLTAIVAVAAGVGLGVAAATGVGAGWGSFAAVNTFVVLLGGYAGGLLRMGTMMRWAVARVFASLELLVPLMTRALPLLLLAVTFLFINAEVWQVAALLERPRLWLCVLGFGAVAVLFLLVRLPQEVRAVEDGVDDDRLVAWCAGTPAAGAARGGGDAGGLPRLARANLVLVLLFNQAVQVVLVSLVLAVFFVVFGALTIPDATVEAWTGTPVTDLPSWGDRVPVSNELFQVAVFLSGFSGLYFTVYAVTDATYREQFFASLADELARAVAVHAVYTRLRQE